MRNFFLKNTTLKQKMKLLSNRDFEVSGRLFFVLEPICSAMELKFKIINEAGNLTVTTAPNSKDAQK